jgi:CRISPR/Cas system-associated endoribonuclease Cas2
MIRILFFFVLLIPVYAYAEPYAPAYQYQCLPELGVIQIQELPHVPYSTSDSLQKKELSKRQNIFFAGELTGIVKDEKLTQGLHECCHQGTKTFTFTCSVNGQDYQTDISAIPYNVYPTRRCGAASPYLNVSIIKDDEKIVDSLPFSPHDCGYHERMINLLSLRVNKEHYHGDYTYSVHYNKYGIQTLGSNKGMLNAERSTDMLDRIEKIGKYADQ